MPNLAGRRAASWWRNLARRDPYFAVLTQDEWRNREPDDPSLEQFFETGRVQIVQLLDTLACNGIDVALHSALEFGCGVGRLLVPLAERFQSVVGLDVSSVMLAESKSQLLRRGLTNFELIQTNGEVPSLPTKFDFIVTYAVLQHLPHSQALQTIDAILRMLRPSGVVVIHFLSGRRVSLTVRIVDKIQAIAPPILWIRNYLAQAPIRQPPIETNVLNVNAVLSILRDRGFGRVLGLLECYDGICLDTTLAVQRT